MDRLKVLTVHRNLGAEGGSAKFCGATAPQAPSYRHPRSSSSAFYSDAVTVEFRASGEN